MQDDTLRGRTNGTTNPDTSTRTRSSALEGLPLSSSLNGLSLSKSAAKQGAARLARIAAAGPALGRVMFSGNEVVAIYNRDRGLCGICGHGVTSYYDASIDHMMPLALGGTNELDNLQLAHIRCNQRKFKKAPSALPSVVMHWEEAQPPLQIISITVPGVEAHPWDMLRTDALMRGVSAGRLLSAILRELYSD